MTDEELQARKRQLTDEERAQPPGWYYLSFASKEKGFLGAAIVQGQGPATAIDRSRRLKLNPGDCQVLAFRLDDESLARTPVEIREKLLGKADLKRLLGPVEKVTTRDA